MAGSENKKEDLEKERNKIIQDKIKELESELKKEKQRRQDLENKIEKIKPNTNNLSNNNKASQKEGISRRQFLKKAGLGTAGLAALMSPVSGLDVRSDSFGVFTEDNQDNPYFSVGQGGPVNIWNTYLDLNNGGIRNVGDLELPQQEPEEDAENRVWINPDNEQLKVKIGGNIYTAEIQSTTMPESVIDDFEGGNLNAYSGDTGSFEVNQNDPVIEGDQALKSASGGSNDTITSSSLDGIPLRGERFAYLAHASDGAVPACIFGVQDLNNLYGVQFRYDVNEINIMKDGTTTDEIVATKSVSLNADTWYDCEVEWQSDAILFRIWDIDQNDFSRENELQSVSFSDTEYDSGDFGWVRSFSSGSYAWDYAVNWGSL